MRRSLSLLGVLAASVCTLLVPVSAKATTVAYFTTTYVFSGNCVDCTNPYGTLVLKNYTPGTSFSFSSGGNASNSSFVSFSYSSSIFKRGGAANPINVSTSSSDTFSITGSAGGTLDTLRLFDSTTGYYFLLGTGGAWCAGNASGNGPAGDCQIVNNLDRGTGGALVSSTPEPGGLALLGTGIAFAGTMRRRLRK